MAIILGGRISFGMRSSSRERQVAQWRVAMYKIMCVYVPNGVSPCTIECAWRVLATRMQYLVWVKRVMWRNTRVFLDSFTKMTW